MNAISPCRWRPWAWLALCCFAACGGPAESVAGKSDATVVPVQDIGDAVSDVPAEVVAVPDTLPVDVPEVVADLCSESGCPVPVPCGDGTCDAAGGEDLATCPADCRKCGDGVCSPGEGPKNCAEDCCGGCGDGKCVGFGCGESPEACPKDCGNACGNQICDKGENPGNCSADCAKQVCGNHVCETSDGGPVSCPQDCAATCGNCVCEKSEDFVSCPNDCGYCGDDTCSLCDGLGETQDSCPADCGDLKLIGCTTAWGLFCKDGSACTDDTCQKGKGCVHLANSAPCDDGNACTTEDSCAGGACTAGTEVTCDDANPCTQDGCDPVLGCSHNAANDIACEDGDLCTHGEACQGKACVGGKPIDCNDLQPCTDDSCAAGACVHLPNQATCSDGNACTTGDGCQGGKCAGGPPPNCDDGNPCTQDACNLAQGCTSTTLDGIACSDGQACTVGDVCLGAACKPGKPIDCDDGNVCSDDACMVGACLHLPNSATCTDANACTVGEHCLGGACGAGTTVACDDGNPCTKDACDLSGGCTAIALDALPCSDGDACTLGDQCAAGACKAGLPMACGDANPCTDDACTGGACAHLPNSATCTDGNACTEGEGCGGGSCAGGSPLDCDDKNVCTFDVCATVSGTCVHAPVAGVCDDGLACTSADHCQLGACVAATTVCEDNNPCTTDSCDPATGNCQNLGIACDDGLACTYDFCGTVSGCTHVGAAGQQAYVKASKQIPGGHFGNAVAVDGDTMVVGAPDEAGCDSGVDGSQLQYGICYGTGAAYVFVRKNGAWVQQAYLKSENPTPGDGFGGAVAISGESIVIGAAGEKDSVPGGEGPPIVLNNEGAAYVFVRKGDTWSQQARLLASNRGDGDRFGDAVAISGQTVLVGAKGEASASVGVNGSQGDDSAPYAGAAYVFTRTGAIWTQEAYLKASNADGGDWFGSAVGVSGDTIVVGAFGEASTAAGVNGDQTSNMWGGAGAAYVFVRQAGVWSQQAYLKASNPHDNMTFGWSLAISGDTLVVGAKGEGGASPGVNGDQTNGLLPYAGAAYVFVRTAAVWHQEAYLKASNPAYGADFGNSVAISGDAIAVGSDFEGGAAAGVNGAQTAGLNSSGAAYLFLRNAKLWHQEAYLKASNPAVQAQFATAVALSGHTMLVGASGEAGSSTGVNGVQTPTGQGESGAAYVFLTGTGACDDGNPCTIDTCDISGGCQSKPLTGSCDDGNPCTVGESCTDAVCANGTANACDDGNACTSDSCDPDLGCVHADNMLGCDDGDACSGPDVCAAGTCTSTPLDCNDGDACTTDSCTYGVGCVHPAIDCDDQNVCTTDTCSAATNFVCAHPAVNDGVSCDDGSQCSVGDVCGGGVCTPGAPLPCDDANACSTDFCNTAIGCVHATSAGQLAYLKASAPHASGNFAQALAVDGDTMVVGSPGEGSCATGVGGSEVYDPSCFNSGAAYVFVLKNGAWQQQAYLKASNTQGGVRFGAAVAVAGDVIVVGAPYERSSASGVNGAQDDTSAYNAGAAYVFVRKAGVWGQEAYLKASNNQAYCQFGTSVAAAGDTVVVGSFYEASGATGINGNQTNQNAYNSGAAYVFARQGSTWSQTAYVKASNTDSGDHFGSALALSGDTLVVGAYGESSAAWGVGGDQGSNALQGSGAAYIFVQKAGVWSQQAYLKASNPNANDLFGIAVAVSGDTVVIGAESESSTAVGIGGSQYDNSAPSAGAAYVFVRKGTLWSQQAYLKASNTNSMDWFGVSVAVSGNVIAVGAENEASAAVGVDGNAASNALPYSGAAYLFARHDGVWSQRAYLKASNPESGDGFGTTIALSGSQVVVGSPWEASAAPGINGDQSSNAASMAGAAYAFVLDPGCDDDKVCTADSCAVVGGCQFATLSGPCEDGDPCTTGEACVGTSCQGGSAKNCDDANACTDDSCQAGGVCTYAANNAPCSDGNVCTIGDACSNSACGHVSTQVCNDNKDCTVDSCDAVLGCQFTVLSSTPEQCNGLDDDCNGVTDEGCDDDGDGWCDIAIFWSNNSPICPKGTGDCDDTQAEVHPGATETCGSGVDSNCDNLVGSAGSVGCSTYFLDQDGDGYGQNGWTKCQCAAGWPFSSYSALAGGDCLDMDPARNPGHAEWCDGVDNNCTAGIDEGCDQDGDGYCAVTAVVISPLPAQTWFWNHCAYGGGDCDDSVVGVHPGMLDSCNGRDDDCNGQTDEGIGGAGSTLYYYDSDGDGYGVSAQSQMSCHPIGLYRATSANDCNDNSTSVNPGISGAVGCGDGVDNNCNGATDESGGCL